MRQAAVWLAAALLALGCAQGAAAAAASFCSATFTLSTPWASGKGTSYVSINVAVSTGQSSITQVPWTLSITSSTYLSVQQVSCLLRAVSLSLSGAPSAPLKTYAGHVVLQLLWPAAASSLACSSSGAVLRHACTDRQASKQAARLLLLPVRRASLEAQQDVATRCSLPCDSRVQSV